MIRRFFTQHPLMKLIALSFSLVLWWFVRAERQNAKTVDVAVTYVNAPKAFVISKGLQEHIRLSLSGPQSKLARVDDNYFPNHVVDLKSAKVGENSFWINKGDFRLPFGVYATQIFPQSLRVHLKAKKERRVSVRPRYAGTLPKGIKIKSVKLTPKMVLFKSFADELRKIDYFYTEPINLNDRRSDFEGEYFVDTVSFQGELETEKVKVVFDLEEGMPTRTLESIPILLSDETLNLSIEPPTVNVKLTGLEKDVQAFLKLLPEPRLNENAVQNILKTKLDQLVKIELEHPDDIEISIEPSHVTVSVKKPSKKNSQKE